MKCKIGKGILVSCCLLMLPALIWANGGGEAAPAAETEKALAPVELQWYVICDGQPVGAPAVMDRMAELMEPINATLDLHGVSWGEYKNKINLLFASGEAFDILFTGNWLNYAGHLSKGYLMDITDMVPQYLTETYDKTIPARNFDSIRHKGKIYGIPVNKAFVQPEALIMREDMVEKYDIPLKMKYDELKPYLDEIREKEDFIAPVFIASEMHHGSPSSFEAQEAGVFPVASDPYAAILEKNNRVTNYFAMPEMMDWLKARRENYLAGNYNQDNLTAKAGTTHLAEGMYAAQFHGGGPLNAGKINSKYGPKYTFKLIDLYTGEHYLKMINEMTSISYTSKNPERAMMFLDMMNSAPEVFNTLAMGLEGKHWEWNGDKTLWRYPAGVDAKTVDYGSWRSYSHIFGNSKLRYIAETDDISAIEAQNELDGSLSKSVPAISFVFDQTPVKSDVAKVMNVYNEYYRSLATGTIDPEENLPLFLDKLDKAGISVVLAEMQKQLDAYYAAGGK